MKSQVKSSVPIATYCMAGLGEACTHIAAILFHTETASCTNGSATCTQKECQWVIPTYQKDRVPYAPLRKLDFSSAKSKKCKIDSAIASTSKRTTAPVKDVALVKRDSPGHDIKSLYLQISKYGSKPAILLLVPPHAQD